MLRPDAVRPRRQSSELEGSVRVGRAAIVRHPQRAAVPAALDEHVAHVHALESGALGVDDAPRQSALGQRHVERELVGRGDLELRLELPVVT